MKRFSGLLFIYMLLPLDLLAQSVEIMPGTERIFTDVQFLETFDQEQKWSLFSRSRATIDYEDNSNLFTGAYLNYTTKLGIGATVLGRISSNGSGGDVGVHFFKARSSIMVYALTSISINSELSYSWFSILRYTPKLSDNWKIYSSLELFSNFSEVGHVASVQRIRTGFDRNGHQFGVGLNLSGLGKNYTNTDTNPGLFLRKQF